MANAYRKLEPGETYQPIVPAVSLMPEMTVWSASWGLAMVVLFSVARVYIALRAGNGIEATIPIAVAAIFFGMGYIIGIKYAFIIFPGSVFAFLLLVPGNHAILTALYSFASESSGQVGGRGDGSVAENAKFSMPPPYDGYFDEDGALGDVPVEPGTDILR